MAGDELYVDPAVVDGVRDELSRRGADLDALPAALARTVERALEGAGEFADSLAVGATTLELSWGASFEATARSLGNVAVNVGGSTVDLRAVDLDLSG